MMKHLPKQVLIVIGSAVIGVVLVIGIDRVLGFFLNRTGYFTAMQPNIVERYTTREFTFTATISAQGIRNEPVAIPKPKNTFRILALGDSFTYGWGVDLSEAWPKLVEAELNTTHVIPGKTIEVVDAGVPGADPSIDRKVCQAYFSRFNPDLVMLGFSSLDDAYQLAVRTLTENKVAAWLTQLLPTLSRINIRQLGGNSYKGEYPGEIIDMSMLWKREAQEDLAMGPDLAGRLDPRARDAFAAGQLNPGLIETALEEPNYAIAMLDPRNLDLTLAATSLRLQRLRNQCTHNTPVVFVMLPISTLVNKAFLAYRQGEGFAVDSRLPTLDLDTPFSQVVKKNGFTYVSLISTFRNHICTDCFYPWDYHYTRLGHQLVAQAVSKELDKIFTKQ